MVIHAAGIIAFAQANIGLHEDPRGSNRGAALEKVLAGSGFTPGEFWCMYFAIACVAHGFGGYDKLPPSVLKTGSCNDAAMHAKSLGSLVRWPVTGCIFVLPNAIGHFHHAGIVTGVDIATARIRTIEGNSNEDGSRNGWEVVAHERNAHSVGYIIWKGV